MSPECALTLSVIFLLIMAASARGESVCTVNSSGGNEILFGSSLNILCSFRDNCVKHMFQDNTLIYKTDQNKPNEVSKHFHNLTKPSTFLCRCNNNQDPCGIDITPGYPPDVPQNLTCVRETELGNVSCTWTAGRNTNIPTKYHLQVESDPCLTYTGILSSTGSATFPIVRPTMNLTVTLNISNSLGKVSSGPHTFNVNDMVKPARPKISRVNCSSRWCHLNTNIHRMHLVQVQYGEKDAAWTKLQANGEGVLKISSLQPYTMYNFQIRRKINRTVGLWSDWSPAEKAKTTEETPAKVVDVWYLYEPRRSQSSKCFRIFWKSLHFSDAKGHITHYSVTLLEKKKKTVSISTSSRNQSVCCGHSNCSVSVSGVNAVGQSPDHFVALYPPCVVSDTMSYKRLSNHSVALFWSNMASAGKKAEYVVFWYPFGDIEGIQWIRVMDTTVNITGLLPERCYQGAVAMMMHSSGPIMTPKISISTWQSVPDQGPVPQRNEKESESVRITWSEISAENSRGCLTKYTVYVQDRQTDNTENYIVQAPARQYEVRGLLPNKCYTLWVAAWTDEGEGPRGSNLSICMQTHNKPLMLVVVVGLICVSGLCYYYIKRRLLRCGLLRPREIPDPANSKWAKEYAKNQGEMECYIPPYDSSLTEELINVEVEEVPQASTFNGTYIKSFTQESGSSDTSKKTELTVDYISTHGAMSEEDEEETEDQSTFFHGGQVSFFGGKLTLDAVKIDCSELLNCT